MSKSNSKDSQESESEEEKSRKNTTFEDSDSDDSEEEEEVHDLVQNDNTAVDRGSMKRRASSKIFSLAKAGRMNKIYENDDAKSMNWEQMFTFENMQYQMSCGIIGAKNVQYTEEMTRFIPEPNELIQES